MSGAGKSRGQQPKQQLPRPLATALALTLALATCASPAKAQYGPVYPSDSNYINNNNNNGNNGNNYNNDYTQGTNGNPYDHNGMGFDPCTGEVMCPDTYDPVCGTDGMTYPNVCQFSLAQCTDPTLELLFEEDCSVARHLNLGLGIFDDDDSNNNNSDDDDSEDLLFLLLLASLLPVLLRCCCGGCGGCGGGGGACCRPCYCC